jgi:hypothetical protein
MARVLRDCRRPCGKQFLVFEQRPLQALESPIGLAMRSTTGERVVEM